MTRVGLVRGADVREARAPSDSVPRAAARAGSGETRHGAERRCRGCCKRSHRTSCAVVRRVRHAARLPLEGWRPVIDRGRLWHSPAGARERSDGQTVGKGMHVLTGCSVGGALAFSRKAPLAKAGGRIAGNHRENRRVSGLPACAGDDARFPCGYPGCRSCAAAKGTRSQPRSRWHAEPDPATAASLTLLWGSSVTVPTAGPLQKGGRRCVLPCAPRVDG